MGGEKRQEFGSDEGKWERGDQLVTGAQTLDFELERRRS